MSLAMNVAEWCAHPRAKAGRRPRGHCSNLARERCHPSGQDQSPDRRGHMASRRAQFSKTLEVFGQNRPKSFTNTQRARARRLMGGSNRVTSGTVCDAVDGHVRRKDLARDQRQTEPRAGVPDTAPPHSSCTHVCCFRGVPVAATSPLVCPRKCGERLGTGAGEGAGKGGGGGGLTFSMAVSVAADRDPVRRQRLHVQPVCPQLCASLVSPCRVCCVVAVLGRALCGEESSLCMIARQCAWAWTVCRSCHQKNEQRLKWIGLKNSDGTKC
jgi:hypothetical protein